MKENREGAGETQNSIEIVEENCFGMEGMLLWVEWAGGGGCASLLKKVRLHPVAIEGGLPQIAPLLALFYSSSPLALPPLAKTASLSQLPPTFPFQPL